MPGQVVGRVEGDKHEEQRTVSDPGIDMLEVLLEPAIELPSRRLEHELAKEPGSMPLGDRLHRIATPKLRPHFRDDGNARRDRKT
jgi:hypothetical protein